MRRLQTRQRRAAAGAFALAPGGRGSRGRAPQVCGTRGPLLPQRGRRVRGARHSQHRAVQRRRRALSRSTRISHAPRRCCGRTHGGTDALGGHIRVPRWRGRHRRRCGRLVDSRPLRRTFSGGVRADVFGRAWSLGRDAELQRGSGCEEIRNIYADARRCEAGIVTCRARRRGRASRITRSDGVRGCRARVSYPLRVPWPGPRRSESVPKRERRKNQVVRHSRQR